MATAPIRRDNGNLILSIRVQPRASRDEIVGLQGESLKIRITAPPVDGKANDHLLRFIARQFGVPRQQVVLLGGDSGRDKRIRIDKPKKIPEAVASLIV